MSKFSVFRNTFKSDTSRFTLKVGLKFAFITVLVAIVNSYILWLMLSMDHMFFESKGFIVDQQFREAFFDYTLNQVFGNIHWFVLVIIILFLGGMYLGKILIRPFEIIAHYCDASMEDINYPYNPDVFSDYKLLTRFSEFFFAHMINCRNNNKLTVTTIPPQFTKIHAPRFERVFFFHFLLLILIISLIGSIAVSFTTFHIHSSILALAEQSIRGAAKQEVIYFLSKQGTLFDSLQVFTVITIVFSYLSLAVHLYGQVSGAIFGYFSTMRSFLKGKYHGRVHLVGYQHIRPYSRRLNAYLDYLEKNYSHK